MDSIGVVELSSVAVGYQIEDAMLKAATVEIIVARTICSGKYLIVVGGGVADVETSVQVALNEAEEAVIDHLVLPRVHDSVFPALGQTVMLEDGSIGALGVIETFSGTSALAVADMAAKSAQVTLIRIHVAMALGGKGLVMMTGTVADVEAAVAAGSSEASNRGLLVARSVISNPSSDLLVEYL